MKYFVLKPEESCSGVSCENTPGLLAEDVIHGTCERDSIFNFEIASTWKQDDFIPVLGFCFIISSVAARSLTSIGGKNNWKFLDVNLIKNGKIYDDKYFLISSLSVKLPVDWSKSKLDCKETIGGVKKYSLIGFCINDDQVSGLDLFVPEGTFYFIASERFKNRCEVDGLTGIRFVSINDIRRPLLKSEYENWRGRYGV